MSQEKKKRIRHHGFLFTLIRRIRKNKKAMIVYSVLSLIVLAVIVLNIFDGRWENVFTGVLALLLLLIPPFVEHSFKIRLPTTLEILAYLFVFCAEILGEIGDFYRLIPFWDTMLHTFNGFMFAAFGFCLVDIFNKNKRFRFELSPFFLALVAFCFSMTIGVLWEFFEYSADMLLATDMQKDVFVQSIHTVSIPNDLGQKVSHIHGIESTAVLLENGQVLTLNGYLDIGLIDTMKDLFVNFIGALVFCVVGYFYVKQRGKGKLASQFIPIFEGNETEQVAQISDNTEQAPQESDTVGAGEHRS